MKTLTFLSSSCVYVDDKINESVLKSAGSESNLRPTGSQNTIRLFDITSKMLYIFLYLIFPVLGSQRPVHLIHLICQLDFFSVDAICASLFLR